MFCDTYGPLEKLRVADVPRPSIADGDVLVKTHAAALHVGDCYTVRGAPYLMRAVTGLTKPKYGTPGFDVAGMVEAVGATVKNFRPGDEVFGASFATCAEYVRVPESTLAIKPASLTFEEAAAIPTSGLAALHGLRDAGKIQSGQKVLVIGASGGVGTFAVQIAKSFGAEVTGVCSTANVDIVRSIGADHVIDYTQEDFAQRPERYDLIFDNIENRSLSDCRRALTPAGTLVLNSGTGAKGIAMLVRMASPIVLSPFSRQTLRRFLSRANADDLKVLRDLAGSGELKPVIDRRYPLADTVEALKYIEKGHARGKVVVTI
jgi:NADPH:quinone reductase-like Zn-dependent oxidoreductase